VTTAELRRAVKAVDPEARVAKVDDGHWTVRTHVEADAVKRLLPSLGLTLWPELTDHEGSRWDAITVLHVVKPDEPAREERATKKTKKASTVATVKLNERDWQWVRAAGEGNEYAQGRVADLLGWDGDNEHRGIVREWGENHAIVDVEIDGSVYGTYKLV
jgi:hypothetical protein